jgi:hypothetical protein|tara:strand:- start:2268 stop:2489 length:222 start_codon:yes stop_codon:yes gene_type:complete
VISYYESPTLTQGEIVFRSASLVAVPFNSDDPRWICSECIEVALQNLSRENIEFAAVVLKKDRVEGGVTVYLF